MASRATTPAANDPPVVHDAEFAIYQHRRRWPHSADRVFVPEAVDTLADLIWGTEDVDLDRIRREIDTHGAPPERSGVLWTMVNLLTRMFVDGALTTYVRPIGGEGTVPLRDHDWDRDDALGAVAEGTISLTGHDGVAGDHWVFLDRVEFELLAMIHSPAGGPPQDMFENLRRRHDRLADIVMANLAPIARSGRATLPTRAGAGRGRTSFADDPTREEFESMFGDTRRVLEARHQIALIARVAGWLVARIDEDEGKALRRPAMRSLAKAAFAPYLSNQLFDDAWKMATSERPARAEKGRPTSRA